MINLSKLADIPYRHYLLSKALSIAVEEMRRTADPNEKREIEFMQNLIDVEYPQFSASKAQSSNSAIEILTQSMELTNVTKNGVKIFDARGIFDD
jgi:hypothetical protein